MTKLETTLINYIEMANKKWNLFKTGERVIIGISGGKDSLSCLRLLSLFDIKLTAIYVDFFNASHPEIEKYCRKYADYQHITSDILNHRKSIKNICFTCSRQRRRLLLEAAQAHECTTIALGHHKNDVVETLLLNQVYSREISTMMPKQALFNGSYHIIRPMYFIPEPLLVSYVREQSFPIIAGSCDHEKDTKRLFIKNILEQIQDASPGIDVIDNIFSSMQHIKSDFIPS